jgi:glycosyltransferase involved in cell wall biosynthesis
MSNGAISATRPGPRATAAGVRTILAVRSCDCGIQGPENLILALAEKLRERDIRYVIVNLWDGDPPAVALHEEAVRRGLESHVLATTWGTDPRVVPRLAALVRQVGPDVVHTHDIKAEFAALIAARLRRTPIVGSYYGRLVIHSLFLKGADWLRPPAFRLFDRVLANSQAQRAELLQWRIAADRIALLPSFVDTGALRPPTPAEALAARRRLDIEPSRPVLATVARLSPNKGHTYMLKALAAIRAEVPDILYLVPGDGDASWHGEGGLRGALEREAADLGYYPDLTTILHATDLLVSPSLREGMQVSLLEAMATGLPIVATAIGGTPDAVEDGVTGRLVPPADPAALATAVLGLLHDRDLLRRMGEAGRQRAVERFDARVVAETMLRVCGEVVARA